MGNNKSAKREATQEQRTIFSLSLSIDEKKALQQYALDNGMTAAAVVQGWIKKYCKKDK